jgi:hypothetical protein
VLREHIPVEKGSVAVLYTKSGSFWTHVLKKYEERLRSEEEWFS